MQVKVSLPCSFLTAMHSDSVRWIAPQSCAEWDKSACIIPTLASASALLFRSNPRNQPKKGTRTAQFDTKPRS